jgi:hypothetical protein
MKLLLVTGILLFAPLAFGIASDYNITILKTNPLEVISRHKASTNLAGKSIAEIFGAIAEIRFELSVDRDVKSLEQNIRRRIDHAKCIGRDSEVVWHKATWLKGHIMLKSGRILSVQILMSGIIVGDLLFAGQAEQVHERRRMGSEEWGQVCL